MNCIIESALDLVKFKTPTQRKKVKAQIEQFAVSEDVGIITLVYLHKLRNNTKVTFESKSIRTLFLLCYQIASKGFGQVLFDGKKVKVSMKVRELYRKAKQRLEIELNKQIQGDELNSKGVIV